MPVLTLATEFADGMLQPRREQSPLEVAAWVGGVFDEDLVKGKLT